MNAREEHVAVWTQVLPARFVEVADVEIDSRGTAPAQTAGITNAAEPVVVSKPFAAEVWSDGAGGGETEAIPVTGKIVANDEKAFDEGTELQLIVTLLEGEEFDATEVAMSAAHVALRLLLLGVVVAAEERDAGADGPFQNGSEPELISAEPAGLRSPAAVQRQVEAGTNRNAQVCGVLRFVDGAGGRLRGKRGSKRQEEKHPGGEEWKRMNSESGQ